MVPVPPEERRFCGGSHNEVRDSPPHRRPGFSSQATYNTEVHPTVVWAKFQAMADGARLASQQLWGKAP
jgi:hypothetical protein